jgi:hypothetical protein
MRERQCRIVQLERGVAVVVQRPSMRDVAGHAKPYATGSGSTADGHRSVVQWDVVASRDEWVSRL